MNLFDNLYQTLHDNNRPFMDFVVNHSQYKHECEIEQQREDPVTKNYDRHTDTSILGSVKRRLIAPKLRVQHTNVPTPTTYLITSSATNDSKPKVRTLADDIKRNVPKESMGSNGKVTSIFSSSKVNIHSFYSFIRTMFYILRIKIRKQRNRIQIVQCLNPKLPTPLQSRPSLSV